MLETSGDDFIVKHNVKESQWVPLSFPHIQCVYLFFYSRSVLEDPWPCLTSQRKWLFWPWTRTMHVCHLWERGGLKRGGASTVMVLCSDWRRSCLVVGSLRSLTVRKESMLVHKLILMSFLLLSHLFTAHWHEAENVLFCTHPCTIAFGFFKWESHEEKGSIWQLLTTCDDLHMPCWVKPMLGMWSDDGERSGRDPLSRLEGSNPQMETIQEHWQASERQGQATWAKY